MVSEIYFWDDDLFRVEIHLAEKSVKQQKLDLQLHDAVDDIKYSSNKEGAPSLSGVATTGENGS